MSDELIQPVILCGGAGTRLWPLSREHYPKQLLPLTERESLLQATALRLGEVAGDVPVAPPLIVSNEAYRFVTAEQCRAIGRPPRAILLEPAGRNTAPALTLAAHAALAEGGDPLLLAMPADQRIADVDAFRAAVALGARLAAEGNVVTFGIVPDRPETGYGYLRLGQQRPGLHAWALAGFVEKPDLESARAYVADGRHWWNAGIFLLRASVWLAAITAYAPAIAAHVEAAWRAARREGDFIHAGTEAFLTCPADSIDYAVMEPLCADAAANAPAVVLPLAGHWSDVGSWDAVWRVADKDAQGNVARGDHVVEDVRDSLVIAQSRLVACMGLRNMVVVETPDAVFVAGIEHAQEVRRLVGKLKSADRTEAASHRKQHRPWGYYDTLDFGDRFHVKRIVVHPRAALSLQMHHHRAEHWIVVRGTARVTRGDETFLVSENESTYIPLGVRHRLENPGKVPLEMIEVQSGAYLGEDDIVRFDDSYGRVPDLAGTAPVPEA